jgi:hypothetical protein
MKQFNKQVSSMKQTSVWLLSSSIAFVAWTRQRTKQMFSSRVLIKNMNISMKKYIYVYIYIYKNIHRLRERERERERDRDRNWGHKQNTHADHHTHIHIEMNLYIIHEPKLPNRRPRFVQSHVFHYHVHRQHRHHRLNILKCSLLNSTIVRQPLVQTAQLFFRTAAFSRYRTSANRPRRSQHANCRDSNVS